MHLFLKRPNAQAYLKLTKLQTCLNPKKNEIYSPHQGASVKLTMFFGLIALLFVVSCTSTPPVVGPTTSTTSSRPQTFADKITGTWRSVSPEENNIGQFSTRELRLTATRWEMIYTLAQDAEMKNRILVFKSEGPYSLEGNPTKQTATQNVTFKFSKKFLNRLTKDRRLAKIYKLDECKLGLKQELDVTEKGCSFVPKLEECPQEYDLIKLEGDVIHLGTRPQDNNICTTDRRPESVGAPLKRVL